MTRTKTERALIAYAVLKNELASADLYQGLMGFFRPVANDLAGTQFIPSVMGDQLRDRYGLYIPPLVIEGLSSRLEKAGLLKKTGESRGAVSYVFAQSGTWVEEQVTFPQITQILEQFRAFARSQNEECRGQSDEILEKEFLDRLLRTEALGILSRRDGRERPKRIGATLSVRRAEEVEPTKNPLEQHLDFTVARFILETEQSDPAAFQILIDVASANLAAETLLSYREPPSPGDAFDELDIYLDAPLCLDILGVNGGRETYGQDFLSDLKQAKCRVNVFLHSVLEIERILEVRSQNYVLGDGPFESFKIDSPVIRDRVRLLAGHVENTLTDAFGFHIVDSKTVIPSGIRNVIGAKEESEIREQLAGWRSDEGREVDVASLSDLIRMRSRLEVKPKIMKAGVILATRNSTLMRVANKTWAEWLRNSRRASSDRVSSVAPLAITDKHLAGLIWITQGGEVGDISRAMLIANCAAATSTRKDVITRVYNTLIDISPGDVALFSAVINDHRAERTLMNITFGDPDVVTNDNVFHILDDVRRATAAEVAQEKQAEIAALNAKIEQVSAEKELQAAQHSANENALRGRMESAELAMTDLNEREANRQLASIKRCFKQARWSYNGLIFVGSFLLGAVVFVAQQLITKMLLGDTPTTSSSFATSWLIPMGIAAISWLLMTWDIPEILLGFPRDKVSDWIFRRLAARAGIHDLIDKYDWHFKTGTLSAKFQRLSQQ